MLGVDRAKQFLRRFLAFWRAWHRVNVGNFDPSVVLAASYVLCQNVVFLCGKSDPILLLAENERNLR